MKKLSTCESSKLVVADAEFSVSRKANEMEQSVGVGLTSSPSFAHFLYVLDIYRYMLLCLLFGSMSAIVGISMLSLSLILRSKTSSMQLLESVPLYMPALILICNGTSMIAFMNKKTRRFYLLKSVCGLFLLVALLLIIVSVTTWVIHIPRLHSHRECAYTQRLRACTCVQNAITPSIGSKHFIMEDIASCELVHGVIFDCLRVMFALSLASIMISVFSIMTLYQLYIHERQKLYFNQLNSLRHRIQQRKLLQRLDMHESAQSVYVDPIPQLHVLSGSTPEVGYLPRNKCLSMEFSSQDTLLDQSSTNFGVSNPKHQNSLSSRGRIWSSQSSNFDQVNDAKSDVVNMKKSSKSTSIRRYMSMVVDRSGHMHSYVRQKLSSFRHSNSVECAPDQTSQRLPPPHVALHRFSMVQSSIDSPTANCLTDQFRKPPLVNLSNSSHKSDSTSPSYTTSSSSASLKQSQVQVIRKDNSNQSVSAQSAHTQSTVRHGTSDLEQISLQRNLQNVQPKYTTESQHYRQSDSVTMASVTTQNAVLTNKSFRSESFRPDHIYEYSRSVLTGPTEDAFTSQVNMSHPHLMAAFACLDEDELAQSSELSQQKFLFGHISRSIDDNPLMENKSLQCEKLECQVANSSSHNSFNELASVALGQSNTTKHTGGSDLDCHQYITAFEEAFKNYYDSQNRISIRNSQQYFTLPIKTSKSRSWRRTQVEHDQSEKIKENYNSLVGAVNDGGQYMSPPLVQSNGNLGCSGVQLNSLSKVKHLKSNYCGLESRLIDSEDEFPAIEPPVDYQNTTTVPVAAAIDKNERKGMFVMQNHCEMDNQPPQPYQYWVQQFFNQVNRPASTDTIGKTPFHQLALMENFDTFTNGSVDDDDDDDDEDDNDDDDDDAGDTSTSQDIADFELELDEEPVQYIGDEDYKRKLETIADNNQIKLTELSKRSIKTTPPIVSRINCGQSKLTKNNYLIERKTQLNNITADYGLDGFRKGCFEEVLHSSSSSDSSLSNSNQSMEHSTNSTTAEYIKPPTPFTNYYINQ